MNKIVIEHENGRTSITINGMKIEGVIDFSITQDDLMGFPVMRIGMIAANSTIEAGDDMPRIQRPASNLR